MGRMRLPTRSDHRPAPSREAAPAIAAAASTDPATGEDVTVKAGRYGPYLERGDQRPGALDPGCGEHLVVGHVADDVVVADVCQPSLALIHL